MSEMIEAPVRLELIGKGGTAIWCGDRMIASMIGARTDHRSVRQDAEEIVRRFNAHADLVRALTELCDADDNDALETAMFARARIAIARAQA